MSGLTGFSMDFFSLKGKTVFITGANTGLGQGYAIALATAGADLFIVTYDREWEETEKLITAEGVKVKFFQAEMLTIILFLTNSNIIHFLHLILLISELVLYFF